MDVLTKNRNNKIELNGSAADFLSIENLSDTLYQVKVTAYAKPGTYTLILSVRDKNLKNLATSQSTQISVFVKVNLFIYL